MEGKYRPKTAATIRTERNSDQLNEFNLDLSLPLSLVTVRSHDPILGGLSRPNHHRVSLATPDVRSLQAGPGAERAVGLAHRALELYSRIPLVTYISSPIWFGLLLLVKSIQHLKQFNYAENNLLSLRFSTEGPAFPEQLVDALLTGEVVFLCGAGVSAPQLPDFKSLVERCFKRLGMEKSASEEQSFKDGRFEEVLGSLSRRIVDPADMTKTVVELLKTPGEADLAHHRTILRLSRNLENRPVIVTTNFDTMLEKALLDFESADLARQLSFAGQDLPTPGSASFGGIIHLHGRVADEQIDLEETPLVVTSADYGDAYMRSGWASRFLFDLCRCKTIILIGYSAGDAPVRYFLNVLEADRQRFPDLRAVYALDSVNAREEPDARWSALAVQPIVYEVITDPISGKRDHSALWRDLDLLADVVERPRITRRAWAQGILGKYFSEALPSELDRVLWLLRGSRDVWPVAISTIEDVSWLDFFVERNVWSNEDAAWIFAAWLARDLQSATRFSVAVARLKQLGEPFAEAISRHVRQARELPEFWLRAWRLLSICQPRLNRSLEEQPFAIQERLRGQIVLSADLYKAVGVLAPLPELTSRRDSASLPPSRLSDLIGVRWSVQDQGEITDLIDTLVAIAQPNTIMAIATAKLQEIVCMSVDFDLIDEDFDSNEFSVPSIEPHTQNEHHEGLIFLVQLLARLLPEGAKADRAVSRSLAESWCGMSGFLGIRLWLHALRNTMLFTGNEAIAGIVALPHNAFWHIQRELALVLRERSKDADLELVSRVERRILTEADTYFERYTIGEGQVDWRGHASDTEVWLRLSMLEDAGVLSEVGSAKLIAIKGRREYLDRKVEERDLFRSYSTGVQMVVGDIQPIVDATDDERLEIAKAVTQSSDIRKHLGWSVYCRTDPSGAFDTLSRAPLDYSNVPLWGDLIGSLSFRQEEPDAIVRELTVGVFKALEPASDAFITPIVSRLADLYFSAARQSAPEIVDWWTRLFDIAVAQDIEPLDANRELFSDAINSPGGRLTEAELLDIRQSRQAGEIIVASRLDSILHAAAAVGRQGTFARAILIRDAAFILSMDGHNIAKVLDSALDGTSSEAMALRAVLVSQSGVSAAVSSVFSRHILLGVVEDNGRERRSLGAAAKILAPALAIIRQEQDADQWGIGLEQTASSLRRGAPALREGAVQVLKQWIFKLDGGPGEAWRTCIGPLLSSIWPRDRVLCEKQLTVHFAELAVASADAFPQALKQLLPYLTQVDGHFSLHSIEKSDMPERFPQETLILLWRIFGPGCTSVYGLPKILERMIKAERAIELDRRLQWLDQKALRYE